MAAAAASSAAASSRSKLIKVVSLDITGTVIGYRKSVGKVYADALKWSGALALSDNSSTGSKNVAPNEMERVLNQSFSSAFKDMSKRYPTYGCSSDAKFRGRDWWKATVLLTFEKSGIKLQKTDADIVFRRIYQEFACKETYEILPDAQRFFNKFESLDSRHRISLAITTNAPFRTVETLLPLLNCHRMFDFAVTAEDVGHEKPSREIFERTLELARRKDPTVLPENVLHVGDSFISDFCGAKLFGFNALYLDRLYDPIITATATGGGFASTTAATTTTTTTKTKVDALTKKYTDTFGSSAYSSSQISEKDIQQNTIKSLDEALNHL